MGRDYTKTNARPTPRRGERDAGGKRRRRRVAWRDQFGELAQLDPHEFYNDPGRERRIWRARGAKKAVRARWSAGPLDHIIAQLVSGKKTEAILQQCAENTELCGLEWRERVERGLTHANFSGGRVVIDEHAQRTIESPNARKRLLHLLRQLNKVRRYREFGRDLLCARGQDAFHGRQKVRLPMSEAEIDLRHDMACHDAALVGKPLPPRHKIAWVYCPKLNAQGKNQLGGQAGQNNVSVPTIWRWCRVWELVGVAQSHQPRSDAPDAVMPRIGKYAYSEFQVLGELPALMLRTLARWWAKERRDNPHKRPRAAGEPRDLEEYDASAPATGPPWGRADAARAFDDLGRDMRLSLSDLDDLEQSCGYN